ncbi:MAG: MotA/TolQ/ExbB proton channel family protein [Methyloligellaceae bacterium]
MTQQFILEETARIYGLIGPVGAILVFLSFVSLTLIIIKMLVFLTARLGNVRAVENALVLIETGDLAKTRDAIRYCRHPVSDMMRAGVAMAETNTTLTKIEAKVRAVAHDRLIRFSRHNRMLELIGLIAPLLGLLGTILGMIKAFQALQVSGAEADPSILAGGIWEALLTTALGLAVAIPAIVAFNLAENRIDRLRQQASAALGRFFASLEAVKRP